MAITRQTVTHMTAKEMQRLPKEAAVTLKGTLLVEKVLRTNVLRLPTALLRSKLSLRMRIRASNRVGHTHN